MLSEFDRVRERLAPDVHYRRQRAVLDLARTHPRLQHLFSVRDGKGHALA